MRQAVHALRLAVTASLSIAVASSALAADGFGMAGGWGDVAAAALAVDNPQPATAAVRDEGELAIGGQRTIALLPGERRVLRLAVAAGRPFAVDVLERGIDLDARLTLDAEEWRGFEGDVLRHGRFRFAGHGDSDGVLELSLYGDMPGSVGGDVEIRVHAPALDDPQAATRWALDVAEAELAQRFWDPRRAREPRSLELARRLWQERIAHAEDWDAARALFLWDRLLARIDRRGDAIPVLEAGLPFLERLGDRRLLAGAYLNLAAHHRRIGSAVDRTALQARARDAALAARDDLLGAMALNSYCYATYVPSEPARAPDCLAAARALAEASGDARQIAAVSNNLGGAFAMLGRTGDAIDAFARAATIQERYGLHAGLAQSLGNLGQQYMIQGRLDEAARRFARMQRAAIDAGDAVLQARAYRWQGQLRLVAGDSEGAQRLLREGLAAVRRGGDRTDHFRMLSLIGEAKLAADPTGPLPPELTEAQRLAGEVGEPRFAVEVLQRVAAAHLDAGRLPAARDALEASAGILRTSVIAGLAARQELLRARHDHLAGREMDALAGARRAQARLDELGDRIGLADALRLEGDIALGRGERVAAGDAYRRGLEALAPTRASISEPELRAQFFATRRALHEGLVVARAEQALASRRIDAIYEALAASDGWRAQVLRERLDARETESGSDERETAGAIALREREAALVTERLQLADTPAGAARREALELELARIAAMLAVPAEARTFALPSGATIREQVQRRPPGSTLLYFFVGRERGYLWEFGTHEPRLRRVPGADRLEGAVAAARGALVGHSGGVDWSASLAAVCDALGLAAKGSEIAADSSVIVVPDGPIHAVPWAALPCLEGADSRRSAVILWPGLQPAGRAGRGRVPEGAGILAVVDPVYEPRDPRLADVAPSELAGTVAEGAAVRSRGLARLVASRQEAKALAALAPPGRITVLSDFEASREASLEALAEPLRIAHFGTHGVVLGDDLSASGIVLSLLGPDGRPRDGFLSAREVSRLALDVDTVVLGACDTGAGDEVAGEGLTSIAYAFLAAGARHVVAAAWPVSDLATSRFMGRFYDGLIGDGLPPERALQAAQAAMAAEPRWSHPRHWAGFQLHQAAGADP